MNYPPPVSKQKDRSEQATAKRIGEILETELSPRYTVSVGKNLLYKIEVDPLGRMMPESLASPMRGKYAFQTDILIEKRGTSVPLVVVELKSGSYTTHDVITYSAKATQHKGIYPYLRYGLLVIGSLGLGRRFATHHRGLDFAMALPGITAHEMTLVALVRRQIKSAERLTTLTQSSRVSIARYEEVVDIEFLK